MTEPPPALYRLHQGVLVLDSMAWSPWKAGRILTDSTRMVGLSGHGPGQTA